MTPDERHHLTAEIERQYAWYNRGSRFWSALHHGSLFGAAVLSAAAALVLKLSSAGPEATRADWGAALAAAAALAGTLAASGGFTRIWQANRLNRGRINQLRIDLTSSSADPEAIRLALKKIIEEHDRSIVGETAAPPP